MKKIFCFILLLILSCGLASCTINYNYYTTPTDNDTQDDSTPDDKNNDDDSDEEDSGITADDVDMQITTINKSSATIKLTFTENENLVSGAATAYVTSYKIEDGEETSPQRQDVNFSGDIYTSATVSFSSLSENQEYHFVLYVTFNKKNKKIKTITGNTTTEVSKEITSKEDFTTNLVNDTDGEFVLTTDLDFSVDGEKESLSLFSTEAKAFMGTIDGGIYDNDGKLTGCHKISNFQVGSATYSGLFGYLKNATVKNLIIENVKVDFSSKSSSSIGTLAGYAIGSNIENVTVNNVTIDITSSSTAEHNTGGIVGYSKRTSFKNVIGDNIAINYKTAKIKINVGLFAGKITGDALIDDITAQNCGVTGSINLVSDYTASSGDAGAIYLGGFVGSLSSSGSIENCYTEATGTVSTNRQNGRTYDVYIGGFVGANGPESSMMYIKDSLALIDITVYGGPISTDDAFDYSTYYSDYYLATNRGYVGGFVGKANGAFRGITNSYVMQIDTPEIYATVERTVGEGDEATTETALYAGEFYGYYTGTAADKDTYLPECDQHVLTSTSSAPSTLSEELIDLIEKYLSV